VKDLGNIPLFFTNPRERSAPCRTSSAAIGIIRQGSGTDFRLFEEKRVRVTLPAFAAARR
jgi:hypothetical protein